MALYTDMYTYKLYLYRRQIVWKLYLEPCIFYESLPVYVCVFLSVFLSVCLSEQVKSMYIL